MHCYLLLVGIQSYLKSGLRHIFLILHTYHLDIPHLREQGCDDPWLFFEAERGPRAKTFGKHWPSGLRETSTK